MHLGKILKLIAIGVFMVLCFFVGYLFGLNQEKNPKGNGLDFYVEKRPETASTEFSTRLIYHSTIQCPAIKDGILLMPMVSHTDMGSLKQPTHIISAIYVWMII